MMVAGHTLHQCFVPLHVTDFYTLYFWWYHGVTGDAVGCKKA
jgi:hypothetical protein